MKRVLNRPLTLRHLLLVAVAALTLGAGATAVAVSGKQGGPDEAGKVNLGSSGGLNYRSNTATTGPGTGQDYVAVQCPNSKHVTGGGAFSAAPFSGSTQINSSNPLDDGDGNSAPDDGWEAYFDNFSGGTYSITAYAICKG